MGRRPRLVYVEWLDHADTSGDTAWQQVSELRTEPETCHTVGWLVRESEQSIVIAHTWSEPEVVAPMVIVRAAIVRLITLTIPPVGSTRKK